jgi:hypothetical protein
VLALGTLVVPARSGALPAPPRKPLPFETVIRTSVRMPDPNGVKATTFVAANATIEAAALGSQVEWQGKVAEVDFRTHFMIGVFVRDRASLTIRSIRVKSVSRRFREFCISVGLGDLASSEAGRRVYALHAVSITSTRALRRSVPDVMRAGTVLRDQNGALLTASRGTKPGLCS